MGLAINMIIRLRAHEIRKKIKEIIQRFNYQAFGGPTDCKTRK